MQWYVCVYIYIYTCVCVEANFKHVGRNAILESNGLLYYPEFGTYSSQSRSIQMMTAILEIYNDDVYRYIRYVTICRYIRYITMILYMYYIYIYIYIS